jgi:hypothetical protein
MTRDSRLSPLERARLGAEIVRAYVRVRRSLARASLPAVVAELRAAGTQRRRPRRVHDEQRLARAVLRTTRALPSGSSCLTRALVLLDVLGRRGMDGALVIAVLPGGRMDLDAHAWVEVNGRPVLPPAPGHGRLVTL